MTIYSVPPETEEQTVSDIDTIYNLFKKYDVLRIREKNPIHRFRFSALCTHLDMAMTLAFTLARNGRV